jgi:hypothetical protein
VMLQELFEGWWTETLHRRQARHHKFPFVLVVGRFFFFFLSLLQMTWLLKLYAKKLKIWSTVKLHVSSCISLIFKK